MKQLLRARLGHSGLKYLYTTHTTFEAGQSKILGGHGPPGPPSNYLPVDIEPALVSANLKKVPYLEKVSI